MAREGAPVAAEEIPLPARKTIPGPSKENLPPGLGQPGSGTLRDVPWSLAGEPSATKTLAPFADKEPREFPAADPHRPPVSEPFTPPPITDPHDEREALLPSADSDRPPAADPLPPEGLEPLELSAKGPWTWRGRYKGMQSVPAVQAGHRLSSWWIKKLKQKDRLAIEDADANQLAGNMVEAGKKAFADRESILINGTVVDLATAERWARDPTTFPNLTPQMVKKAKRVPGWVSQKTSDSDKAKAEFMREQLKIIAADPNHPLRPLIKRKKK
jgi:hypothetical protein